MPHTNASFTNDTKEKPNSLDESPSTESVSENVNTMSNIENDWSRESSVDKPFDIESTLRNTAKTLKATSKNFLSKMNNQGLDGFSYEDDCKEVVGTVISFGENTYSKTHVSGGGHVGGKYGGTVQVRSSTSTHNKQIIWIKTDAGEEIKYQFTDKDLDIRESHTIKIISSRKTGKYLRVSNLTTGNFWKLDFYGPKASIVRSIFIALFFSLPFFNLFIAGMLFSKGKYQFDSEVELLRPSRMPMVASIILGFLFSYFAKIALDLGANSSFFMFATLAILPILATNFITFYKSDKFTFMASGEIDQRMA